jgi:hypothetical protein
MWVDKPWKSHGKTSLVIGGGFVEKTYETNPPILHGIAGQLRGDFRSVFAHLETFPQFPHPLLLLLLPKEINILALRGGK